MGSRFCDFHEDILAGLLSPPMGSFLSNCEFHYIGKYGGATRLEPATGAVTGTISKVILIHYERLGELRSELRDLCRRELLD
jgi:hypothetical protein